MTVVGWNRNGAVEEKFLAEDRAITRDAVMGEDETMRRSEATVDARAGGARLRLINELLEGRSVDGETEGGAL